MTLFQMIIISQLVHFSNLVKKLVQKNGLPNLLFYGPPGTGKTTTALILAKILNGEKSKHLSLELNASDARGIDTVRNDIKRFAEMGQLFSNGTKFIILDEADAMTNSAQFALRRVIEKFTKNVRFCFICNHINKIIPAIQSRCTKMRFNLLNTQSILKRLKFIAEKEKIKNDEEGLKTIIELSKNDMRNCINILQCCWYGHNEINAENVYKSAGIPQKKSIDKIVEYLLNEEFHFCFKVISNFQVENGVSLDVLVALIFEKVQRIDFPENALSFVIEKMAQTEYRVLKGCSELIARSSLVAIFIIARKMIGDNK